MCPYICIHLYKLSYENIFHHPIRLDSQQLPGHKNLFFFKFQKEEKIQTHLCSWEINIILILYFSMAKSLTKLKSCVSQTPNASEYSKVYWRNAWPLLYLPIPCFLLLSDNRLTFLFRFETVKLVFQHHQPVCWILSLYLVTWKKKIPVTFWISSHFNAVQNSQK